MANGNSAPLDRAFAALSCTVAASLGALILGGPLPASPQSDDVRIVRIDAAIQRYADSARHIASSEDRARLYRRWVVEPNADCPRRSTAPNAAGPDEDPAVLAERVARIAPASDLIRVAVRRARATLPGPSVVVCLDLARSNRVLRELGGVAAFAAPEGAMYLFIDPTQPEWSRLLPFTVAHEYHHLAAFARGLGMGDRTVQGRLVFEGKADVFASLIHPDVRRPWHAPYSLDDQQRCWDALRSRLHEPANTTEFTNDYLVAWTGRAPRFCGYAAGRRLVLRYLAERPGVPPRTWSGATPEEIVAGVSTSWP